MESLQLIETVIEKMQHVSVRNTTKDQAAVYLACIEVLQAHGDGRANGLITQGANLLDEIAGSLSVPENRHSFMTNVPSNAKLLALAGRASSSDLI